ncbi:LuxR C-terminal-related transcriptional regulator [Raoultibacter massiliensis]|uniref:LuxR C-terminal-related transcriptional regulator n=1 Tax=Raoultibacter massiliensis TaxID=1852371 RepID=A0ABV1JF39_9ACTN|nr:LuxR C-terminal-related transcriptional regulator [Raoultibacter massiliensis]
MRTKKEATKKKQDDQSIRSRFAVELNRANIPMTIGFALCQLWLTLCFFAPQLFPDNSSVSVYEISLGVCAVSLLPALFITKRLENLLENKMIVVALAACAGIGTFTIPFSAGDTATAISLQIIAGVFTGLASGWFFVAWYQAFCKADDLIGFVLSVLVNSLFMYVLTAVAYIPELSPWFIVCIASGMPLASAALLIRSPRNDAFVSEPQLPPKKTDQRKGLLLLCCSIFVISFIDEFMRNYYLQGSDLLFYSGGLNLVLLIVKICCSIALVVIIADHSHRMSLVYRISFLLTMTAVLFMPYAQHSPDFMYGVTNFGAFLFKIMIMIIAFNFCQRYRTSPTLVFSLTRIAFSLDLLLGFGMFHAYRHFSSMVPDLLGVISVVLGILVVATYSFVFTDRGNIPIFVKVENEGETKSPLDDRCSRLIRVGKLSRRESDVLRLIAKGRSTPRIQKELHLSMNTVNTHTSHIYQKLKVHSRQELLDLLEETAPEESEPCT